MNHFKFTLPWIFFRLLLLSASQRGPLGFVPVQGLSDIWRPRTFKVISFYMCGSRAKWVKARAVCQYHSFISPHYFPCLRTQQDYMLVWPVILDSCWAVARQRGDVVSTRNESFVEVNRRRCPEMSVIGCCAEVLSMYKCNKLQSVSQEELTKGRDSL